MDKMARIDELKELLVIANIHMMGRRRLTEEELVEFTLLADTEKVAEFCKRVWNDPKITPEELEKHLANMD